MTSKRIPLDFKTRGAAGQIRSAPGRASFRLPPALRLLPQSPRWVFAACLTLVAVIAGVQLTAQPTAAPAATPAVHSSAASPVDSVRDQATATPPAPAPAADQPTGLVLEIQSGDTLDRLFRNHDLNVGQLTEIMQLPMARQHLRLLRPGDIVQVTHQDGDIVSLEREVDLYSELLVDRREGSFAAELVRLPVEVRVVEASGRISRSLFEAGSEARVSDRLIMNLTEIFRWDIDFVRDIGIGDAFTLLYEELWRNGEKLGEGNILAAEFINRGSRYTAVRFADDGDTAYYTEDGRPMQKAFLRVPVAFTRISSEFNPRRRHPILNTIRAHKGVDYAARSGTPVKAAGDGKVIFRGWKGGYGNTVIVQHGGKVTTLYAHLSRFATDARYGSRVRQGDVIAFVGATGLATAPHLHYEYRRNGVHLNPRTVDLPDAEPLAGATLQAFQSAASPLLERLQQQRALLAAARPEG